MGAASSSGTSSAASSLEWGSTCAAASLEAEPGWSPRAGGGVATSAVVVCACEQRAGGRAREHRAGCSCGLCEGARWPRQAALRRGAKYGHATGTTRPRGASAGERRAREAWQLARGHSGARARLARAPTTLPVSMRTLTRPHAHDRLTWHTTTAGAASGFAHTPCAAGRAHTAPAPGSEAEGCRTFDLARRSRSNGLRRSRRSSGVTKSGAVPPPRRRGRRRKGGAQGPGPSWVC